jgi:hypothetical protein
MQIAQGDPSRRGVHKLNELLAAEPQFESGIPASPRLKGDARLIYDYFRDQLAATDMDRACDCYALERAANALSLAWKADRYLARQGEVITVPILAGRDRKVIGRRQVKNKWLAVRQEADRVFKSFACEFGVVGPSSRVHLAAMQSDRKRDNADLWRLLTMPRTKDNATQISNAPLGVKSS